MLFALDPRCELSVLAARATPQTSHEELGCGLQGPVSRAVRRALEPLRKRIRRLGEARALERADELVEWLERQPAYDALCTSKSVDGRRQLKTAVLYPRAPLSPRVLHVRGDSRAFDYAVGEGGWPALHDLVTLLGQGASEAEIRRVAGQGGHELLVDELVRAGWAALVEDDRAPAEARGEGLWFVGHNSVFVASGTTRLLVDPWFRPWREADPPGYRPLRPRDLGPVDAIAITHSHGDHFHLGSLLAFARDTPLFVPAVERESILATDLARRLREVGFTRVRALDWWETATVGDLRLEALPFFGEQPSSIAVVDPKLRNVGNTWIVRTPRLSAALLADTGRDGQGSMAGAALEARRRFGPVDLVFGGMRGFSLAPLFLPFTTLDAMFVNVPRELVGVRQQLMHDAADLVEVSEVLGARAVVPYADGGAPWYWREGMGPAYAGYPAYPGQTEAATVDVEQPRSAPFPERLAEAARAGEARVCPLVLRPGDLVRAHRGGVRVGAVEGFAWPYEHAPARERS